MTAPTSIIRNPPTAGVPKHQLVSCYGQWDIPNTNLKVANSAAELLYPATIATSSNGVQWIRRGDLATRVLLRARFTKAATVISASPVVTLWGAYLPDGTTDPTAGNWATDGTVKFMRLDNVSPAAAGLTLTLVALGSGLHVDASYGYSDIPSLTGYDLMGCNWWTVLCGTAAAGTGLTACDCQALQVN
jgi:hypothetical protein